MYYFLKLLLNYANKLLARRTTRTVQPTSPVSASATVAPLPAPQNPAAPHSFPTASANPLEGKPFRYLIGADGTPAGKDGEIIEVGYDATRPCASGISIKYCNLFDEKNTGGYGPYLHDSDTAQQYGEGQIDPKGAGWRKNILEQITRAKDEGFEYVEWDNPDAYPVSAVLNAVALSNQFGLKVIAKNPLLIDGDASAYVRQCHAVIVERGAGNPADMDALRKKAGKPTLPIWFVAFGDGRSWADNTAHEARQFRTMSVTYSRGEYTDSEDAPLPNSGETKSDPSPPAASVSPVNPMAPASDPSVPYATEYLARWKTMQIEPECASEVQRIARKLIGFIARYHTVEAKTGVPWYVIAVLHERESGCDFDTYLGNGNPLHRKTTDVPRGRGPFSSWEAGAIDALHYDGLDQVKTWPIERIAYECERYNGFGYRSHGVPSAYLWSFSNIYQGGKYVADGVWSSSAQDKQCGTMPMLRAMVAIDATIPLAAMPISSSDPPKPVPPAGSEELHDLGYRIKRTMLSKSYPWFDDQNVVSVEGMDPDGTPNNNRPNAFDDIKMVLDGRGKIIGGPWEATTQPGVYWTTHPMAEGGAFIIALGSQACWTPGEYHGKIVWRQAEDSTILGHRDPDYTYKRHGPPTKHGNIGVHHHGGYNLPRDNISNAAAGCQVIRLEAKQQEFMQLTLRCPRYLVDQKIFRLTATVLEAKDILP
jgi:lysozyme family protein